MKGSKAQLLCLGILFVGVGKDNNQQDAAINTGVILFYSSTDGKDLLDPGTKNNINYYNTDIYYVIGGREEKQFYSNLDFPKHFMINKDTNRGRHYFTVYLNPSVGDGEISTTIIKYKSFESDTIQGTLRKTGNNISISNIILNGIPISAENLNKIVIIK